MSTNVERNHVVHVAGNSARDCTDIEQYLKTRPPTSCHQNSGANFDTFAKDRRLVSSQHYVSQNESLTEGWFFRLWIPRKICGKIMQTWYALRCASVSRNRPPAEHVPSIDSLTSIRSDTLVRSPSVVYQRIGLIREPIPTYHPAECTMF